MATETRPHPHESEIATIVLAEVDVAAHALQSAGIDARVLGNPWVAVKDLGYDAWSHRMGIAVPHEQADRARELLHEWRQHREAKIQNHMKGLWRAVLRIVAMPALVVIIYLLVGGEWRTSPVLFSVLTIIVIATVTLDLMQYVVHRKMRRSAPDERDESDEGLGVGDTGTEVSASESDDSTGLPVPDRPPAKIGDAEVVVFTVIDDRRQGGADPEDEAAAGLAICRDDEEGGFYLFSCDASWNTIWDTCHGTLDEAKQQAEYEYPGVLLTWRRPA